MRSSFHQSKNLFLKIIIRKNSQKKIDDNLWNCKNEEQPTELIRIISAFILLHEKFLQSDWLRALVFQLNLKYLHVKITNLLRVVV